MVRYRGVLVAIASVEKILGALLIVNIVANIGVQVFSRYVFNYPLVWVEELATYSFIWATFVGASLGLKQGRHIKIETVTAWLSPRRQAGVRVLVFAIILALLLILLPQAWSVMGIEGRSRSISLPIAIPRSWFYSIPLFVGAASMLITVLYLLLQELTVTFGGHRLDPILTSNTNTQALDAQR